MDDHIKNIKTAIKSAFEPVKLNLDFEYKLDEGYEACKDGAEFWQNPYSYDDKSKRYFQEWFAGWCRAKKEQANNG